MSKNGEDKSQLYARIPPDLFERVKAAAELLSLDRDQFVTECLEEATRRLKPIQELMKQERETRKKQPTR
jgi:uncharacterized protein (DUF1778 family)